MIAVIDYGAGNLRSAVRSLEHVGAPLQVTNQAADLRAADAVVLPGVGATRDTMDALDRLELSPVIPELIRSGIPFLGICVACRCWPKRATSGAHIAAWRSSQAAMWAPLVARFGQHLHATQIPRNGMPERINSGITGDSSNRSRASMVSRVAPTPGRTTASAARRSAA